MGNEINVFTIQRTHFTLKIAAYDNGSPQLSGYMQLKINILDVNDNPPGFQEDEYNVYIPVSKYQLDLRP